MRVVLAIVLATVAMFSTALAQTQKIEVPLGEGTVTIVKTINGQGPTYVSLHDNEDTAVRAVAGFPGTLIELRHKGTRNVEFALDGARYTFDPNRIFTREGIEGTVYPKSAGATRAVEAFARTLLDVIQADNGRVIALHNNSEGAMSAASFEALGHGTHREADKDADDFFFVVSEAMYTRLVDAGHNVVLQSSKPVDDGSLSVYCAQYCRSYVNIEAQEGHEDVQRQMIRLLHEIDSEGRS